MMEDLVMIDSKAIKSIVLDYMPKATDSEVKKIINSISRETEMIVFNSIRQATKVVQHEAKY